MRAFINREAAFAGLIIAGSLAAGLARGADPLPPAIPPNVRSEAVLTPDAIAPPGANATHPAPSPHPTPIDLDSALRLAGVRNPQILLARERITEALAKRQLAAVQILPNINLGTNYDNHSGNLQRSTGEIISVHRQDLYVGAGANAVGSGTVNIPGIAWNLQVSDAIYSYLRAQQLVVRRQFSQQAAANQVLLQVADAYEELLRAEGSRAVAVQTRDDAQEIARLTANYARTGQGRKSDADRAATELARRQYDILEAEGSLATASAKLNRLLDIDPAAPLRAAESAIVPLAIVPDTIPLPELIASALLGRPELQERRAAVRQALLALDAAKALPFSPNVMVGMSGGAFGGGSNLATTPFGDFGGRTDFDVIAYWSLRNLGVGNRALVNASASRARSSNYRELEMLDRVRDEVAEAYARAWTRFNQIDTSEHAVTAAREAYVEDLRRIRGREGLPIEVLDSLRLLSRGRSDYLNAIIDFNQAQFELYVAMGQPAACLLTHANPAGKTSVPLTPNAVGRPTPEEVPPPRERTDRPR